MNMSNNTLLHLVRQYRYRRLRNNSARICKQLIISVIQKDEFLLTAAPLLFNVVGN